jgi:Ran GTPase-activating protein (RanGAP) involved in mRNA processing and transport
MALRHLELQNCGVGAAGVAALAGAAGLPGLQFVSLASNDTLSTDAAPALQLLVQRAVGLVRLHLQHTRVGDAGVAAVAAGMQPALQELDISSTGVTSQGL